MSAIDRLYSINNKTVKKSINIDDSLYKRLMRYTKKNYDATFYEKPENETVTYRSIMIRKENLDNLQKLHKKTGISVTRLLNCAVKEFLDKYDNKR